MEKNFFYKKQHLSILLVVLVSILMKILLSFHPHSGEGKPPLHGDFEAQRHWMEITVNLPIEEWYRNSTKNDLMYWGLDYPPLTAYHMWICGKIAQFFYPKMVEFENSRGIETEKTKVFMRSSVLISDILFYTPALLLLLLEYFKKREFNEKFDAIIIILLQPALNIIDFGHFQYNGVVIGLIFFSIYLMLKNRIYLSSFLFTLALNYKVMSMYFSLTYFFFLLGYSFKKNHFVKGSFVVFKIGLVVIFTYVICFFPFFIAYPSSVFDVVKRMFPFERGLYEDKVANFWCSISLLFKIKQIFSYDFLAKFTTAVTLISTLPSNINLLFYPTMNKFILSLINNSFSFFFFSFHVHEKTILFPLAISLLLFCYNRPFKIMVCLLVSVSMFSMYPLLVKDNLQLAYFTLQIQFFLIFCYILNKNKFNLGLLMKLEIFLVYFCISIGHILIDFLNPPERYPDLFTYYCTCFSFAFFFYFWILTNILQQII